MGVADVALACPDDSLPRRERGRLGCRSLSLYDWNTSLSAAFFESIHYLEVGLRNALDLAAFAHIGRAWLMPTQEVLTARSQRVVATALAHASGPEVPHGKIVAELPFGFWWSLLADEYNRRLWQPALRHAFDRPVRRRTLHSELDEVRRLRNRIAHHEPIHRRPLANDLARVLTLAERVSPHLGDHISQTTRVSDVLGQRP
ncbi:Abi family protein [Nocardioides fonticola]|uniref:Abi family protein n=1 Tax=Nocardioides fonticola TaxID=450363 RepID=A0ABP7XCA1_9ACTN